MSFSIDKGLEESGEGSYRAQQFEPRLIFRRHQTMPVCPNHLLPMFVLKLAVGAVAFDFKHRHRSPSEAQPDGVALTKRLVGTQNSS